MTYQNQAHTINTHLTEGDLFVHRMLWTEKLTTSIHILLTYFVIFVCKYPNVLYRFNNIFFSLLCTCTVWWYYWLIWVDFPGKREHDTSSILPAAHFMEPIQPEIRLSFTLNITFPNIFGTPPHAFFLSLFQAKFQSTSIKLLLKISINSIGAPCQNCYYKPSTKENKLISFTSKANFFFLPRSFILCGNHITIALSNL